MKKLLIGLLLLPTIAYSQIDMIKPAPVAKKKYIYSKVAADYVGKKITMKQSIISEKSGFLYVYSNKKTRLDDNEKQKLIYQELAGKEFTVIEATTNGFDELIVIKGSSGKSFYLKIPDKEYENEENLHDYNFIPSEYIEKLKGDYVGKKFYWKGKVFKDLATGQSVDHDKQKLVTCTGVAFSQLGDISLKMECEGKVDLTEVSRKDFWLIPEESRKELDTTPEIWTAILNNKPAMGMNADQLKAAMGSPDSINTSQSERSGSTQWVYRSTVMGTTYVYTTNGIVDYIQHSN